MCIKSYFANRVAVAVELAQRELGEDAVLLSTRLTEGEAREFGKYEVVFGINAPVDPPDMTSEMGDSPELLAVQQEYLRLAASLWAGTDPLICESMKDRDIFDLLGFD